MISRKRSAENLIIISKRANAANAKRVLDVGADGEPCFAALSITRRCHTLSD